MIDFSKEKIDPYTAGEAKTVEIPMSTPPSPTSYTNASKATRRGGEYWIELQGKHIKCGSLRELLAEGLRAIEAARPGTLEKLSHIRPKSKRIVARDRKMLFDSDHLSKDYAEQLGGGWWYGTNNSAAETNTWLERASSCSGLIWGVDVKTSLMAMLESVAS